MLIVWVLLCFSTVEFQADSVSFDPAEIKPKSNVTFKYTFSDPEPEPTCSDTEETCEIDESPFDVSGTLSSTETTYSKYKYNETIFDYSKVTVKYVNKNGVELTTTNKTFYSNGIYYIYKLPYGTKSYTITIPIKQNPYQSTVRFSSNGKTKTYNMPNNNDINIEYSKLENLIYLDSPQTASNRTKITNADIIKLLGMTIMDGSTAITNSLSVFDNKATSATNEAAPFVPGAYGLQKEYIMFSVTANDGVRYRKEQNSNDIPAFDEIYFNIIGVMGKSCMTYETNYSMKVTINGKASEILDKKVDGLDGCLAINTSAYNPQPDTEYSIEDFVTYDIGFQYGDYQVQFPKIMNVWYPTQFSKSYDFETGEGDILDNLDDVLTNPVYMRFEYSDLKGEDEFKYYTFVENFENITHDIINGKVEFEDLTFTYNSKSKIPDYWDAVYFSDVNVDQNPVLITDLYAGINMVFESYFPKAILDDTIRLPYIEIEDKGYYHMTSLVNSSVKILDKFIIERYSGRIYNTNEVADCNAAVEPYICYPEGKEPEIPILSQQTDDDDLIRSGQNDVMDVDMKLNSLTAKGFPLKSNLLNTALNHYEIIDSENLGYNKLDITYKSKLNYVSKMYGYSPRSNSKYYFTRTDISDEEVECVIGMAPGGGTCGYTGSVGGYLFNAGGLKKWLKTNIVKNFPTYISDNERYQQFGSDATPPVVYNRKGSDVSALKFNFTPIVLTEVPYDLWIYYLPGLDNNPNSDFSIFTEWLNVGAFDEEDGDVTPRIRVNFLQGADHCSPTHTFNLVYTDDSRQSSNRLRVTIYMDLESLQESEECGEPDSEVEE